MGGAMLLNLESNFLLVGGAVFPLCFLTRGQTMVEVVKIMATSFKRSHDALLHSVPPALQQATADPCLPRDSWTLTGKSGALSRGVTAPFSWVLMWTRFCLCPPRVCFPVLYKFWLLYCGINDNFLQKGLCHTHIYCSQTRSLCP